MFRHVEIAAPCLAAVLQNFLPTAAVAGNLPGLELQCTVAFSHYDQVEHSTKTVDVRVTDIKHKPGGIQLATQTRDYEFWVMGHGMQTLNGQSFITDFQVAIRHKPSGLFMHALSDSTHVLGKPPQRARISLVQYHADSALETGELLFECSNVDQ